MANEPIDNGACEPAQQSEFAGIKERLDAIVEAVGAEGLPLEEALDLYEEAVGLGMKASELLEEGFESALDDAQEAPRPDAAGTGEDAKEA